MSDEMPWVPSHPSLQDVTDTLDEQRLCPKRGYMEKIAAHHQKKQAELVNNKRAKLSKPVLDILWVN
jgi:hypothetical protein